MKKTKSKSIRSEKSDLKQFKIEYKIQEDTIGGIFAYIREFFVEPAYLPADKKQRIHVALDALEKKFLLIDKEEVIRLLMNNNII